jgi:hypothetical protein
MFPTICAADWRTMSAQQHEAFFFRLPRTTFHKSQTNGDVDDTDDVDGDDARQLTTRFDDVESDEYGDDNGVDDGDDDNGDSANDVDVDDDDDADHDDDDVDADRDDKLPIDKSTKERKKKKKKNSHFFFSLQDGKHQWRPLANSQASSPQRRLFQRRVRTKPQQQQQQQQSNISSIQSNGNTSSKKGYQLNGTAAAAAAAAATNGTPDIDSTSLTAHASFEHLFASIGNSVPPASFQAPTAKNLKAMLRSDSFSSTHALRAHTTSSNGDDQDHVKVSTANKVVDHVASKLSAAGTLISTPTRPDVADAGDDYFRPRSHPLGTLAGDAPDSERPVFGNADDNAATAAAAAASAASVAKDLDAMFAESQLDDRATTPPPQPTPIAFTPQKTELTPRSLLRLERKFNISTRPRSAERPVVDSSTSASPPPSAQQQQRPQGAAQVLDAISVVARVGSLRNGEIVLVRTAEGGVGELELGNTSARAILVDITMAGAFRTSSGAVAVGPQQQRPLTLSCSNREHRGVLLLRDVGTGASRSVRVLFDPQTAPTVGTPLAAKPVIQTAIPRLPASPWLAERTPITRTVKPRRRSSRAQSQASVARRSEDVVGEVAATAATDGVRNASTVDERRRVPEQDSMQARFAAERRELDDQRRALDAARAELQQQQQQQQQQKRPDVTASEEVPMPALWSLLQWDKQVVSFGAVHLEESRRDVVALTNTSSASREFRVHCQPPDAFEASTHGSFVLQAGETASIQVTFRPRFVQKYNAQLARDGRWRSGADAEFANGRLWWSWCDQARRCTAAATRRPRGARLADAWSAHVQSVGAQRRRTARVCARGRAADGRVAGVADCGDAERLSFGAWRECSDAAARRRHGAAAPARAGRRRRHAASTQPLSDVSRAVGGGARRACVARHVCRRRVRRARQAARRGARCRQRRRLVDDGV